MKEKIICLLILFFITASLYSQKVSDIKDFPSDCSKATFFDTHNEKQKNAVLEDYNIHHYLIDIEVSPNHTQIKGKATIEAIVEVGSLDTLVLELIDEMTIDSILLNENRTAFSHNNDEITIALSTPLILDEDFAVTVFYHGNSVGSGVTSAYNNTYGFNVTWSLSESYHAKEWWPTKEILGDKADSATIRLTTDKQYTAASNGLLVKKESEGKEKVTYHWKTRYPINYYLVSFAVADYREYSFNAPLNDEGDSVWIQNFFYDSDEYFNQNKEGIDNTSEIMKNLSALYGPYPFASEKYGHALSEFGGGMEHQTITTIGNFSYLLVAHELAHQWFGDYVTCASWQDIWINEGFASYSEYLALEKAFSRAIADDWMQQSHQYALGDTRKSIYIPFNQIHDESRIFNYAISYKKGAAILHTIRYMLDDDNMFFSILRKFLGQYANSVATGEDFLKILNEESGKDFTGFFDNWYYGRGYPEYTLTWMDSGDSLFLKLEQEDASGYDKVFHVPVEVRIVSSYSDTTVKLNPKSAVCTDTIFNMENVQQVILDPNNWILNKQNYITPTSLTEIKVPASLPSVYPNPFQNYMAIEFESPEDPIKMIRIMDMNGRVRYINRNPQLTTRINTQKWAKGVYILEIVKNNSHLCKKVIKD